MYNLRDIVTNRQVQIYMTYHHLNEIGHNSEVPQEIFSVYRTIYTEINDIR